MRRARYGDLGVIGPPGGAGEVSPKRKTNRWAPVTPHQAKERFQLEQATDLVAT